MIGRRLLMLQLLAGAVLLAACQAVLSGSGDRHPASPARNSPDTVTNPAPATPTDDMGQPTHVAGRTVTVTASAQRYSAGAAISVVVANGLDRTVFSDDSQSDCSVIMLQRLKGGSWQDVPACAQQRPPATVAIGPGRFRTIVLHPTSSNFRISPESALEAGTYRARYTYRFTGEQTGDDTPSALSPPFTIG